MQMQDHLIQTDKLDVFFLHVLPGCIKFCVMIASCEPWHSVSQEAKMASEGKPFEVWPVAMRRYLKPPCHRKQRDDIDHFLIIDMKLVWQMYQDSAFV